MRARVGGWSYYENEEWNVAPVATPKPKVAPKQRERPGSASAMASTDEATEPSVDEATTRAWIAAHYRLPPPADAGPSLADDLPADARSADEAAAAAASPDDELAEGKGKGTGGGGALDDHDAAAGPPPPPDVLGRGA